MSTVLIKQDPVMVANHKDEPPDPEDFILQDALPLFDNRWAIYHAVPMNDVDIDHYKQCHQLRIEQWQPFLT